MKILDMPDVKIRLARFNDGNPGVTSLLSDLATDKNGGLDLFMKVTDRMAQNDVPPWVLWHAYKVYTNVNNNKNAVTDAAKLFLNPKENPKYVETLKKNNWPPVKAEKEVKAQTPPAGSSPTANA